MTTQELEMAIEAAGKVQRRLIEAVQAERGAGRQYVVDRAVVSLETLATYMGLKVVVMEDA